MFKFKLCYECARQLYRIVRESADEFQMCEACMDRYEEDFDCYHGNRKSIENGTYKDGNFTERQKLSAKIRVYNQIRRMTEGDESDDARNKMVMLMTQRRFIIFYRKRFIKEVEEAVNAIK